MKKFLLYLSLSLVAIIVVIFVLLGRYTDRVIDPYVRSLLEHTRPMGHHIEYKDIRVNLFARDIILKDVRMFPDASLTDNDLQFEIKVKKIRLTGFKLKEMLFNKTLIIDEFIIANPEMSVTLPLEAKEVIEDAEKSDSLKTKSPLLTKIFLSKIILSQGSFELIRNKVILASSNDIDIVAEAINLEKNTKDEPIGFTYGDYTITLTNIDLYAETGLYDATLDKFSANKKNFIVTLNGLSIIPKYDKKEFAGKLDFQTDRFDLKLKELEIRHTGLYKLLENKPLEITKLLIDSLDAEIYRDKNVAFNFNKYPLFYNESFLKISIPIIIDTVLITNSRINYCELSEGRSTEGSIILADFNAQCYNLTNLVEEDTAVNVMRFDVQAKIMGEGPMNAKLVLPLEGRMHDIACSGSVGAMNLAPLNSFLEPSLNIKFNAGRLTRMTFDFTGNDKVSSGWMEFLYQDLDVVLLKKESSEGKGFLSYVANTMALSNNPAPGKDLKIVSIGFERDKNKGLINYVWKTIQSGMVHTILPIKKYQINRKSTEKERSTGKSQKDKSGGTKKKKK
jgi:hypothetical protein